MERVGERQLMMCQLCKVTSRRDSRQWLRACPCPQPSHRQCLQYRVWECEARRKAPRCPRCGALYRVEPAKDPVVTALDTIARSWYPRLCRVVSLITRQVAVDSISTTFGFIMLSRVYGLEETWVLLLGMDLVVAVTVCHALPLATIVINYIPWEENLLRTLRRCVF